ncbi:MAG: hypothetical protein IPH12_13495 [Saprospirales bacterium]|nr:hypothetical protein [Saprospirales bacterium]
MSKPVTMLFAAITMLLSPGRLVAQGCIIGVDCTQNHRNICDVSGNDAVFWNTPPFSWSPALQSADLPEGAADLDLVIQDTCPGVLQVKFTLFLDLDGDNLAESALNSQQQLPPGKMLYGNAFTPGYAGTDTLEFDGRLVADTLKFRFAVETQYTGSQATAYLRWTTGSNPGVYVSPRFPEGKHRLLWAVEKNGLPQAFCEYTFRVKDCMAPQLECITNWTASFLTNDTLFFSATDFIQSSYDNITPNSLLQHSLRYAGAGAGFPLNSLGQPVGQLAYTCANLGPNFVELWVRDLAGNTNMCPAYFNLFDFSGVCTPPPDPVVCATGVFVNSDTIRGINYDLNILMETGLPPVQLSVTPLPNGCVQLPDFSPYSIEEVAVTPYKNDDALNGVSTFDVVLINRHILGIQLFDQPWKFLAADANNSGTLTTFDIIELRKLILGIYDSLPNSTSWKFFMADCALDSLFPFQSVCPGAIAFVPETPPAQFLFSGIKTGDVNGNAAPGPALVNSDVRTATVLLLPDQFLAAGDRVELPLMLAEASYWAGCQWALTWDPGQLDVEAVRPGTGLPDLDASMLAQPQAGMLALSWSAATARWVIPGTPVLTLAIRARKALRLSEAIRLKTGRIQPEAYTSCGDPLPLALRFAAIEPANTGVVILPPQPNPTSSAAVFPVYQENAGRVTLHIQDAAGRLVFENAGPLEAGTQVLSVPGAAILQPGVYAWRVCAGQTTKSGRLIRL